MKLHARAKLTIEQRKEIKKLYQTEKISIRKLAKLFRVTPKTIHNWVRREAPLDKTSAPIHHRTVITPEYRNAVINYRTEHPRHGPIRIAFELKGEFPQTKKGTVYNILREEGLIAQKTKRTKTKRHINVGHFRVQMDIQELPAVRGDKGREYNIAMIHLATRFKYSEIHSDRKTETVVEVFRRGLDNLPPFFS
jgi:transposase